MSDEFYQDRPKIILLVSDNEIDSLRIERKLMDIGSMECRLHQSRNIADAVDQIKKRNLLADVVILDLRLRDVTDPVEMCRRMAAEVPSIPIMALNADSNESRAQEAAILEAGASDCINRGQFDDLFIKLKILLNR